MLRRFAASLLLASILVLPAAAQDAGEFVVRLNRLENQSRQLSGQIEQLQYENRQLKEQLRKFQEDAEFRFQELSGARPTAGGAQTPGSPAPRPTRRSDAFDPEAQPGSPGAPRPLGTTPPSSPPGGAVAGPTPGSGRGGPSISSIIEEDAPPGVGAPLDLGQLGRGGPPPTAPPRPTAAPSVAATSPTGNPRDDYESAYAYILQKQYEQAEMGLRQFLQSHPRDALRADATYWLGETYLQRNRHREAAEQFLKVSTEHARSGKAPDAMLKLGVSLNALGARDQACATFAELERKFPQAASSVRQGVDREQKRARCAA